MASVTPPSSRVWSCETLQHGVDHVVAAGKSPEEEEKYLELMIQDRFCPKKQLVCLCKCSPAHLIFKFQSPLNFMGYKPNFHAGDGKGKSRTMPDDCSIDCRTCCSYLPKLFPSKLPGKSSHCFRLLQLPLLQRRPNRKPRRLVPGRGASYIHTLLYIYICLCIYIYIHTDQNLQACMHKTYYIYVPWYSAIHILMDRHMKYIYIYIYTQCIF